MTRQVVFRGQQTTTTSSGTDLTLIDADSGYMNFSPSCSIGDTFIGTLVTQDGQWVTGDFEIISVSPTVVRIPPSPLHGSPGFSLSVGTHTLSCTDVPAMLFPSWPLGAIDLNESTLTNGNISKSILKHGDILRSAYYDTITGNPVLSEYKGNFYAITLTSDKSIGHNNSDPPTYWVAPSVNDGLFMVIEVHQDATGGWTLSMSGDFSPYDNSHVYDGSANIDLTPNSTSYIITINGIYFVIKKDTANVRVIDVDADTTLPRGDENSTYHRTSADTTARTWTIPANSAVPFKIGTKWRLLNMGASGNISVPITTDTLIWLPTGGTGTRTIAPNGYLDLEKITATTWICSGVGVT